MPVLKNPKRKSRGTTMASKAKTTGRPSSYTDELGDLVCEKISTTARGLDFICATTDRLPTAATVHNWLNTHPAFLESYLRARERQADLIFDECLEIADNARNDVKVVGREGEEYQVADTEFIQRSKLRIDTRMRMAGKLAPKKYGEKLALGQANDLDPLVVNIRRFTSEVSPE